MLKKSLFLLLAVAINIGVVGAENRLEVRRETERAISLIEHGRYGEARHALTLLRERVPIDDEVSMCHIDFQLALCAAELRDNEAEQSLLAFLRRYPESVHVNDIRFLLAMYYCEREDYANARKYLDAVSYKALTADNSQHNGLATVVVVHLVAGLYIHTGLHFLEAVLFGGGNSPGSSLTLGLAGIDECHIALAVGFHFCLLLLVENGVAVLGGSQQVFAEFFDGHK